MDKLIVKNISSLEKILPKTECLLPEMNSGSALLNEEFSYQIAYKSKEKVRYQSITSLEVESDIKESVSLFCTKSVPVVYTTGVDADDGYFATEPCLIPDVLEPYQSCIPLSWDIYRSVWVTVKPDAAVKPGVHSVRVLFKCDGEVSAVSEFSLQVVGAVLPEIDIPYTNWLHADCIADWYGCDIFSERHWTLLDRYMKLASDHGVNMMLTPVITPPLDTAVGAERRTVQLLDITFDGETYTFGFDRLKRWLELCRKNNIRYIEVAHLFTQWGGAAAPKVVVSEQGTESVKFGWDTPALSEEYQAFICQLVPALTNFFATNWEQDKVYFHLTDEPTKEDIEHYGTLYRLVKPLLGDFKQMDALSDYALFEEGFVDTPVVLTSSIHNFLDQSVRELWTYTCCEPYNGYFANRFLPMPSRRNRILGFQMYRHDIKGFLHWGYNFYYSRFSMQPVNPYLCNDAEGAFSSGDSFCVYPVPQGAVPSLRFKVFYQGMQDMMAAKVLESLVGKEAVLKILEEKFPITFDRYPDTNEEFLAVREAINEEIQKALY